VVNKYKTCLTNVIREAKCGQKAFLVNQLQPMQDYIREKSIACIRPRNATFNSVTPEEYRAKMDLCIRDKAWETQFLCAKKFHSKLRKIEDDKEVESHQTCRALSRYYSCLNTVLHNEACEEDTELMLHMEYFPKVLSQKYREMCVAELKLTAMNVAKRLSGHTRDTTCEEESATREFFACGLVFNEVASQNPPKEKLCMAYRNLENCTNIVNKQQSCSISSEFQGHSSHVLHELLSSYSQLCRSFQPPVTPGFTTSSQPRTATTGRIFFECGLTYIFNLNDAILGDNPQYAKHVVRVNRQKKVYLGLERQTSCDQFKAVKKLVLCGVAYHRMLTTVENNTFAAVNHTSVCPLVKEMKFCMYSATHDSGCSDALFLNTEISVLKKHLLREFEDVCNALPSSEDKEFKQYRQGM
ncbi:hypothetical protein HPB47_022681, partial [Ixodes persulcatus]